MKCCSMTRAACTRKFKPPADRARCTFTNTSHTGGTTARRLCRKREPLCERLPSSSRGIDEHKRFKERRFEIAVLRKGLNAPPTHRRAYGYRAPSLQHLVTQLHHPA